MSKNEVKQRARELYALAEECGVAMLPACRRAGMATSTPHRWLNEGSEPKAGHMEALRNAVLRLAAAAGSLPKKYRAEFDALGVEQAATRKASDIVRGIARDVSELQRALVVE